MSVSVLEEKYETVALAQRTYSPAWTSLQQRWSQMRDEVVKEVTQDPLSQYLISGKRGLTA